MTELALPTTRPVHGYFASSRAKGALGVLALLIPLFSVATTGFLTPANLENIALQSAILLLIALPMTLVILTEGLDLSSGALLSLCSVVLALALQDGASIIAATLLAALVGCAFGALHGAFVAMLGMPPFVVTLGGLGMAHGLALAISGGNGVSGLGPGLEALGSMTIAGLPLLIWIAAVAYGVFHLVLHRTAFGRHVVAIGGNKNALAMSGVRVAWVHCAVYVISGLTVGLSALCLIARTNAGHPTIAMGMEFDAIAAVVLGGTSLDRGKGWLFGTVLGVAAIGILRNGMNLMAIDTSLQLVAIGLLVIAVLLIDRLRSTQQGTPHEH